MANLITGEFWFLEAFVEFPLEGQLGIAINLWWKLVVYLWLIDGSYPCLMMINDDSWWSMVVDDRYLVAGIGYP